MVDHAHDLGQEEQDDPRNGDLVSIDRNAGAPLDPQIAWIVPALEAVEDVTQRFLGLLVGHRPSVAAVSAQHGVPAQAGATSQGSVVVGAGPQRLRRDGNGVLTKRRRDEALVEVSRMMAVRRASKGQPVRVVCLAPQGLVGEKSRPG